MDTLSLTKEARIYNGEKTVSLTSGAGRNWSTTCKRMKLEHFLRPHTKINSKWIKELNVRPETIQFREENIGKTLSDINHRRILYDPPHITHIISLDLPCAPAPSILYPVSNIDWQFVTYMIVYMFQCHSPKSSHPLPLPLSPKVWYTHLCLFSCLAYRVVIQRQFLKQRSNWKGIVREFGMDMSTLLYLK